MRQLLRCGGMMAALVVLLTAFAAGQNPASKQPANKKSAPQTGEITGKLAMVGGSSKILTLAVEYQVYEPSADPLAGVRAGDAQEKVIRQMMEIQREQARVMQSRNPRERMRRMQELALDMQRLQRELTRLGVSNRQVFKTITKRDDYEIQTDDNTKIRFLQPPLIFDDKGNPKKYTSAELQQMRDPRLPGYKGDFDQLKPGHIVKITLGKKPAPPGANDPGEDLPYATMVLVTGESTPPPPRNKKDNR